MKKHIAETDFIGGEGVLSKEEEFALAEYFAKKKKHTPKKTAVSPIKKRNSILIAGAPTN